MPGASSGGTDKNLKKSVFAAVVVFCAATSLALLLPYHRLVYLAGRGNLFECQQSLCALLASVIFFAAYLRRTDGPRPLGREKNLFFLFMAVGAFFVAGETISWGQRLFYFRTSTALVHVNMQAETNIHNLMLLKKYPILDPKFLFPKILMVYFFFLPLAARLSRPFSGFLGRIGLPLVPLSLGLAFATIIIKFRFVPWEQSLALRQAYMQLKQSDIIFFVLISSVWFLFRPQDKPSASGLEAPSTPR